MSYWRSPRAVRREARRALAYGVPSPSAEVNAAALSYSAFALVCSLSIIVALIVAGVIELSLVGPRSIVIAPAVFILSVPGTTAWRRRSVLMRAMRAAA